MEFFLTLVASDVPLSSGQLAITERYLDSEGVLITKQPEWLEDRKAADIGLSQAVTLNQMKALRQIHDEHRIDIFCTSDQNRRKNLFLADMDSTIVTSETLDELAAEAGIKDKISKITERAMRGELDFHAALKERAGLIKGLSTKALKRTLDTTKLSKGAKITLNSLRKQDVFCVLVSGGFTYFTDAIASQLGFNANHGNVLGIENEQLTGGVQEPILDKDSKLNFLKLYCEELSINVSQTIAIGDGANDLPMLEAAGLGIGYHPKPLLEDTLLNCIRHSDLTSVLYAQGYKSSEIAK
jgi:phosphoserine phosphatase